MLFLNSIDMLIRKDYLDNQYTRVMANRKILLSIKRKLTNANEIEQCEKAITHNREQIKELKTAYTYLNGNKNKKTMENPQH